MDHFTWTTTDNLRFLVLNGEGDKCVATWKTEEGHLWSCKKRFGYAPTIKDAKDMVECLADHFALPPSQRWMSL